MSTRRSKLVFYIFALVAIYIVVTQVRNAIQQDEMMNPTPQTREKQKKKAYKALQRAGYNAEIGNNKAPYQVVVLLKTSDKEQLKTVRLLVDFAKQHPQDIHLSVFPMEDEQATQQAIAAGVQVDAQMQRPIASIYINKEMSFTIKDASGQDRSVSFSKRPNTKEGTYYSQDVITVLEQKIAQKQQ